MQVMAPLLDNNHELNWQANMVSAIERRQAAQHTEGQASVAAEESVSAVTTHHDA